LAHFTSSGAVPAEAVVLAYGAHLVIRPREDQNLTAQAASFFIGIWRKILWH